MRATGQSITTEMIAIVTLSADGRVIAERVYFDPAALTVELTGPVDDLHGAAPRR
ncbi:hypothetical protein ACQ856_30035 (plasmid) [Mycolicibacterium psychrotolerans]|uniref:hypothetical protein n=1 Tax=Mycolicibacterium psychrotolerans TaxID=216929 RepID=UPI003D667418